MSPAAVPVSGSPPIGNAGVNIAGRRVSWDAILITAGGLVGVIFLWRLSSGQRGVGVQLGQPMQFGQSPGLSDSTLTSNQSLGPPSTLPPNPTGVPTTAPVPPPWVPGPPPPPPPAQNVARLPPLGKLGRWDAQDPSPSFTTTTGSAAPPAPSATVSTPIYQTPAQKYDPGNAPPPPPPPPPDYTPPSPPADGGGGSLMIAP